MALLVLFYMNNTPTYNYASLAQCQQTIGPKFFRYILIIDIATLVIALIAEQHRHYGFKGLLYIQMLTIATFVFSWGIGQRLFSLSSTTYRRGSWSCQLALTVPLLLATLTVAITILPWWWLVWLISIAVLGHRKGTQRAFLMTCAAFAFAIRCTTQECGVDLADDEIWIAAKEAATREFKGDGSD